MEEDDYDNDDDEHQYLGANFHLKEQILSQLVKNFRRLRYPKIPFYLFHKIPAIDPNLKRANPPHPLYTVHFSLSTP
jgi:hypothetical protein